MVAKHLRLDIIGDYVPNTLPGEIWQTSVRLALVFGPGTVDDVGTLPDNWEPIANPISRTYTDWDIASNWTISAGAPAGFDPGDYLNDQVAPAVVNFIAQAELSNQVRVRELKLWPIGAPNGRAVPAVPYSTGTPCTLTWASGYPVGANSGTQLPPQNSVCVSLRTLQVGSAGRGRMFLPSPSSTSLSGARLATAAQGDVTDAAAQFLEDISYMSGPFVQPIVTGGNFTKYAVVKAVKVGNVVDTQRRRRNRLSEVYLDTSVNP